MIEFKDMEDMSVKVSFPKDFKLDIGTNVLKMPLEKIKTESFSSADIPFGRLLNDFFSDIPLVSLRGKYGFFELTRKNLRMFLFPKGESSMVNPNRKPQKLISDRELESLNIDINYLSGSFLGVLGLSSQIMNIENAFNFKKEGIFNGNFNNKVKEDFLKKSNVEEVWGISFKRKDRDEKLSTEFTYEFERNDTDKVKVIQRMSKTISPFDLTLIIDRTLKDINKELSEW